MEFHQILASASPGDAITNFAFQIRSVCRTLGPSEMYALHFDPALEGEVLPLKSYAGRDGRPSNVSLIYHASIGEPKVISFLMERPEPLVLVYHNISPAKAFERYDPRLARLLDEGRRELTELRNRVTLVLADSAFNARELQSLGYEDVQISPPIFNLDGLTSIEPHGPTVNHIESFVDGPAILFVGQLLPHKRPDLLVQAYHVLSTYLQPETFLFLVGAPRIRSYREALQRYIEELNLPRAWITGQVSVEQLAAFYRHSDVFVTASEHEGFCVPLLEAMAFDLPIVGRKYGAVPETLDGAGLLLPPEDDPVLMAEAIGTVLSDRSLRESLVARGRERLKEFDPEVCRATFLKCLQTL